MRRTYESRFLRFLVMYVRNEKNYVYSVVIEENVLIVFYSKKQIDDYWLTDKDIELVEKARKNYAKKNK